MGALRPAALVDWNGDHCLLSRYAPDIASLRMGGSLACQERTNNGSKQDYFFPNAKDCKPRLPARGNAAGAQVCA